MFDTWTSFKKQRPSGPVDTNDIWPIFINNKSDTAGALGWHDGEWQGRPIVFGRVFAGDCIRYGTDWRIDLTHEAWEMRGDPNIDRQVRISNDAQGRERIAAVELCDPVEDDLYAIEWHNSKVSDFILPSYFSDAGGPWSHGNNLDGPCPTLASGGYQSLVCRWAMGTKYGPAGKRQVPISGDEEWSELSAGGRHPMTFANKEPGGINYVEDPDQGWTWTLPLVLSVATVIGLGGWWVCG
jgi:hypothetical protein